MTINELRTIKENLESALTFCCEQIEEYENKEAIPSLKEKFEGKYFKYRNSFGCPKEEYDYWYIYVKIHEVRDDTSMIGFVFAINKHGELSAKLDKDINQYLCETEITREEFKTAYSNMGNAIKNMYHNI